MVQAYVEGKADAQGLLMEYCKMKKPLTGGAINLRSASNNLPARIYPYTVQCAVITPDK